MIPLNSFKDVARSVVPIMIIVFILSLLFIDIPPVMMGRFVIGSIIVILGLGIFLWGIEMSVSSFGEYMGQFAASRNHIVKVVIVGLIFGFVITVAEPNVAVLAEQIAGVAGGAITSNLILLAISLGVGLLIGLGLMRIVKGFPMHIFFAFFYGLYVILLLTVVPETFQAIAFDASGSSTGAITTPFFLALALGAARLKGSDEGEVDSFGMVGTASMGPILALMLLSFFVDIDPNSLTSEEFVIEGGLLSPLLAQFGPTIVDSILSLVPIAIVFFILNRIFFKINRRELRRIIVGLFYTFIGLVLFLLGVNSGFMDMGTLLGMLLSDHRFSAILLPLVGFILGAVIVLAEPSVSVLGDQIQDVTGGAISRDTIEKALMVGVGLAVAVSMIRVMVPALRFWMIIVPGFVAIIALSFLVEPIFVGISYDAGGVASGPMSATFLVAMLQGAANVIETANPLLDGFGVLATIAMVPILCTMIVGALYTRQVRKAEKRDE